MTVIILSQFFFFFSNVILSQLTHQVHLDLDPGLDLVMATVGLGKEHEKKSLPRSRRMTSD